MLRALALAAALVGVLRTPAALLASGCESPAAAHGCCAPADGPAPAGCPAESPMPCCQITLPSPESPALLTAAAPATVLPAVCVEAALTEPLDGAPPVPVSARARSSPLFLLHSALLV